MVHCSPHISTRQIISRLGVQHTTMWRKLYFEGIYQYHLQQHPKPEDLGRQTEKCYWSVAHHHLHRDTMFSSVYHILLCVGILYSVDLVIEQITIVTAL
jgi:hypothetical protein